MVMVRMGKVKNGFMKAMIPTNNKLRKRKIMIDKNINYQFFISLIKSALE